MSFNLSILVGNLTRDPEVKYTPKGTACAEFGIACNEVWHDAAGNKHESVMFIDCTAWEKGAEWAQKHLKKGAEVMIEGKLKLDRWEDKTTGDKRSKHTITVSKFTPTFGTWKDGGRPGPQDEDSRRTSAPGQRPAQREKPPHDPDLDPPDDDNPFNQ